MALTSTDFHFPNQDAPVYHGKVRDVYSIAGDLLVMVATDRISAFDVVLPKGIPYKGQVLNQIANYFSMPPRPRFPTEARRSRPMVTAGVRAEGFRVEMIIRGYLAGSAWREYAAGARELCGVNCPKVCARTSVCPSLSSPPPPRLMPVTTRISRAKKSSPGSRERGRLQGYGGIYPPPFRYRH